VIQTQITIINKLGLHARAAAKFVSCASAFSSSIEVGRDGKLVDAKSIMSVMMLAAGKGTVLDLEISGGDEQPALEALQALVDNRFDEEQ
jgi:phosphocarrier protein NPr